MSELPEVGAPDGPCVSESWVYFIQEDGGGPIKIGLARRIYIRLGSLQVGNHRRLRLVGFLGGKTAYEEGRLHVQFRAHRVRGEWFVPAPEVLDFIRSINLDAERQHRLPSAP